MDPASAGVAVVGFAASLAALTGIFATGVQRLWTLADKLKNAPEELKRLHGAVESLQALFTGVRSILQDEDAKLLPPEILQSWKDTAQRIWDDLIGFDAMLEKCCPGTNDGQRRWPIKSRVKKYLNDAAIAHWESVLNGHINKLTLFLSILNNLRASKIHTDLKHLLFSHRREFERTIASVEAQSNSLQSEIRALAAPPSVYDSAKGSSPTIRLSAEPYVHSNDPSSSSLSAYSDAKKDRTKRKSVIERVLYVTWSSHKFPIGILSIKRSRKAFIRAFDDRSYEEEIAFSLRPPRWLTSRVVEVMFLIKSCELGTTSFKWNISSAMWNDNASLERYAFGCNVTGLKRLFEEKKARPTDFLPSGRSLAQQVVLACIARQPNSLPTLQFLVQAGADMNARASDGQTALLLCCRAMCRYTSGRTATDMFDLLFPVAQTLIDGGARPADCGGPAGLSTFSYLFSHSIGLPQLQQLLQDHVDMSTIDELSQLDAWIMATIARADKVFMAKLNSQLAEFHTAPSLSTVLEKSLSLDQVSLPNQVRELQAAEQPLRVEFMRALCRQGSAAMLEPLLRAGIDVHEADAMDRYSYLGEAVASGNHEAATALLDAGADVNSGAECPAPLALLYRWTDLGTNARAIAQILSELPLLEEIIHTPGLDISRMPSLLTRTLFLPKSVKLDCATVLADAGFGISLRSLSGYPGNPYAFVANRPDNPALHGTEWHELQAAVLLDDAVILDFLLSRGAHLEDEDEAGCSALLAALELGRSHIVRTLVDFGAQVRRKSAVAGLSAIDVATRNVATRHPRTKSLHFSHRPRFHTEMVPVELEDDMKCFEIIKGAPPPNYLLNDIPTVQTTGSISNGIGMALWARNTVAELKYRLYRVRQADLRQSTVVGCGLVITTLTWIWYELILLAMLRSRKRSVRT